ncbi:MAG: acyl-CoA carboxylase subunit epsilon [Actinomycetes bacterium]
MTDVPYLRIVRGDPNDEELAALVSVVSQLANVPTPTPRRTRSQWCDPARMVRPAVSVGRGAWRASALPR